MSYYGNDSYQSDSYTSDSVVEDGAFGGVQDSSYQNQQTTDVTDTYDQGPFGGDLEQQSVQTTDTTSVQDSSFGGGW
ncbi:hypothetical protein C8Q72DRAFT_883116 [Fomitopsis betulina]|nr:hypothetical protein C8Q72DRAFT_883116 [Fomitopsis betulina]